MKYIDLTLKYFFLAVAVVFGGITSVIFLLALAALFSYSVAAGVILSPPFLLLIFITPALLVHCVLEYFGGNNDLAMYREIQWRTPYS